MTQEQLKRIFENKDFEKIQDFHIKTQGSKVNIQCASCLTYAYRVLSNYIENNKPKINENENTKRGNKKA